AVYRQIFSEIIIVTNDSPSYTEFKDAEVVTDIYPDKGSLGGIYTGLFYAKNDYAFVAACDMPSLNKDFIFFMIDQIDQHDIIVPELAGGFQALHAIYSRRCLPAIKKMISADQLKIAGLYKEMRLLKINEAQVKPFNTKGNIFININTPDDLKSYKNTE
ncbi:MAG: molybdenum cofactor guanylyltransferase, partial [Syntrophaceae bacterium]|nr:molybdenum cofactor guanylyltransferase [Syntrophaceae bacterium]